MDKLEELAKAATPGPWETDTIENEDGRGGFKSYAVGGGPSDKWMVVCDTLNSNLIEVKEDHDVDFSSAWDEVGRKNAEFIAAANPAAVLELIADLTSAKAEVERLKELVAKKDKALEPFADLAQHFTNAPEEGWLWRGEEPLEITVGDLRRAAVAIEPKEPRT